MRNDDPSWWQHPSHLRKCAQAKEFNFRRTVISGQARMRRESLLEALFLGSSVMIGLLGSGVIGWTILRICFPHGGAY